MSDDSQPDAIQSFDQGHPDRSPQAIANASYQRSWRKANPDKAKANTSKYRQGSPRYKRYRALYMQDYRLKRKQMAKSDA